MATRRNQTRKRGGNFTFASLGKAAMDVLIPASLFYMAKKVQRGRSVRKTLRSR
jgi:hypothetical protein